MNRSRYRWAYRISEGREQLKCFRGEAFAHWSLPKSQQARALRHVDSAVRTRVAKGDKVEDHYALVLPMGQQIAVGLVPREVVVRVMNELDQSAEQIISQVFQKKQFLPC